MIQHTGNSLNSPFLKNLNLDVNYPKSLSGIGIESFFIQFFLKKVLKS